MKKRGGYTFDRIHPVKFRADPKLYESLKKLSEESGTAMAWVLRRLVQKGLEAYQIRASS